MTTKDNGDLAHIFRNEGGALPIPRNTGKESFFLRLSPDDAGVCTELGEKVVAALRQLQASGAPITPPHPTHAGADFGVAHVHYTLDLPRMLDLPGHELMAEYVAIARTIDRVNLRFNAPPPLRFAKMRPNWFAGVNALTNRMRGALRRV